MGHYENGGSNVIGVATTESWAAVWTVDTPYINVIRRDFFDAHESEIRNEVSAGRDYSDAEGQTGAVAVISTNGDVDAKGWPVGYEDASEYVADELSTWTREDGGAYERAVGEGYGR